jgi:hypothetical protein
MDIRLLTSKGLEAFARWVFVLQESFESVQRAVSKRGGETMSASPEIKLKS